MLPAPPDCPASTGHLGFSYPTWKPEFYPAKTPQKDFLHAYAERLPSVEQNATFYQLPSEERLHAWADQTPPESARREDEPARDPFRRQSRSSAPSATGADARRAARADPVQLPADPAARRRVARADLESLDPELEYAFEFRHESVGRCRGVQVVNASRATRRSGTLRLREAALLRAAAGQWAIASHRSSRQASGSTSTSSTKTEPLDPRTRAGCSTGSVNVQADA